MKIINLRKYTDNRGSLVENTNIDIIKQSKHFFISKSKSGVVRGNHYHTKKSEWFFVIQGKCKICVKDINTNKKEEKTIKAEDNIMIHIGPRKAHAFKNIGKKELILLAFVNVVLNHKHPDTIKYILY
jgi:UDP-2-acetamido-2,6-beta-L-arabino-hexul-4-ose reductase